MKIIVLSAFERKWLVQSNRFDRKCIAIKEDWSESDDNVIVIVMT